MKLFDMTVKQKEDKTYQVDQKQYNAWLEEQGVDQAAVNKLKDAETKIISGALEFLKPVVIKSKEKQVITIGQGDGQMVVGLAGKAVAHTIPKKKGDAVKTFNTYGTASLRVKRKIPTSIKENIKSIQDDIEKAFK